MIFEIFNVNLHMFSARVNRRSFFLFCLLLRDVVSVLVILVRHWLAKLILVNGFI